MQVTESSWNRELRKVRRLRQAHARQQDEMLICSLKERVLHLELELQQVKSLVAHAETGVVGNGDIDSVRLNVGRGRVVPGGGRRTLQMMDYEHTQAIAAESVACRGTPASQESGVLKRKQTEAPSVRSSGVQTVTQDVRRHGQTYLVQPLRDNLWTWKEAAMSLTEASSPFLESFYYNMYGDEGNGGARQHGEFYIGSDSESEEEEGLSMERSEASEEQLMMHCK